MSFKEYLYSIRFWILISFLIFSISSLLGYFGAKYDPQEARLVFETMKKTYESVWGLGPFWRFIFVFINNGFTLFLVLVLGIIFGVFPLLVLFGNGVALGVLGFFAKDSLPWPKIFLGILPHGVIEIPVMILACAIGLKIGRIAYRRIFKKEGSIKQEFSLSFKIFLKILLPLLVIAAAIEIFITARIMGI